MGDKYETGRAMVTLEIEKLQQQLSRQQLQQKMMHQVPTSRTATVSLGSVVLTDTLNFYLAAPLGKIEFEGSTYFALSPVAPLAKVLMGREKEETLIFQGTSYQILEVL
jgi:hypothetical protein